MSIGEAAQDGRKSRKSRENGRADERTVPTKIQIGFQAHTRPSEFCPVSRFQTFRLASWRVRAAEIATQREILNEFLPNPDKLEEFSPVV